MYHVKCVCTHFYSCVCAHVRYGADIQVRLFSSEDAVGSGKQGQVIRLGGFIA